MLTYPAVTWPSVGLASANCGSTTAAALNAVPESQAFRPVTNESLRPRGVAVPQFPSIPTPHLFSFLSPIPSPDSCFGPIAQTYERVRAPSLRHLHRHLDRSLRAPVDELLDIRIAGTIDL